MSGQDDIDRPEGREHAFTAEGAPCQYCGEYLDDEAAGAPCRTDPGDLTGPEIGAALAVLVATVVACVALVWSEDWTEPILEPGNDVALGER